MNITEFIVKFNNDPEYRKEITNKIEETKPRYDKEELEKHRKQVE